MHVRYDIRTIKHKSIDGEDTLTRREYNARYGKDAPEVEVPEAGEYLWDWYFDISDRIGRVQDGVCRPIPPSEWIAWTALTGDVVYRWEFAILAGMDTAYCNALTNELSEKVARETPPPPKPGRKR